MTTRLRVTTAGQVAETTLEAFDSPEIEERAEADAIAWIKQLRTLRVDGRPLRDALAYRGDSLWWFVELYLHKERQVVAWFRALHRFAALVEETRPSHIAVIDADPTTRLVVQTAAAGFGVTCAAPRRRAERWSPRVRNELRSLAWLVAALASRVRPHHVSTEVTPGRIVAFVHSAFLTTPDGEPGEERYVGAVLGALQRRLGAARLALVGLGPRRNFRARRFWDPVQQALRSSVAPVPAIEQFAPLPALHSSITFWRQRRRLLGRLLTPGVRAQCLVLGHDLWPLVASELRAVVLLQLTWSVRAMDEAAAVLDALRPVVALTYAEAGGWGRALALEARRRRIPLVGLQHGFIYRHWLNYRHEPDETAPSAANPSDRGFPRPDLTVVFDGYAAKSLQEAGGFPRETLAVAGSPSLDQLVAGVAAQDATARAAIRRTLAIPEEAAVVLVVSKFTQIEPALRGLVEAVHAVPNVVLVIKPHPAEVAGVYRAMAGTQPHVRIAPSAVSLAQLLSVTSLIVTVNSTVAIDALSLGIPTLTVLMPNNLGPLVAWGAMAGAARGDPLQTRIAALLEEGSERRHLRERGQAFLDAHGIRADGGAAERAAEAVLARYHGEFQVGTGDWELGTGR